MNSKELVTNKKVQKSQIKLDIRNQGKFLVGLFTLFYTYYGFICNILMYNDLGNQIQINAWTEGHLIIWAQEAYFRTYFLPALVLFLVCFLITLGEEIPYYGIKIAFWYMPFIISNSIIWYWFVFGVSAEPFILLFGNYQGYLHILIVTVINLSGAFLGLKFKHLVKARRQAVQNGVIFQLQSKDIAILNLFVSLPVSWVITDLLGFIIGTENPVIYDFLSENTFIVVVLCYMVAYVLIFGIVKLVQTVFIKIRYVS